MTAEPIHDDLLICEDLMLLLLPGNGRIPRMTAGLEYALTGALIVDLLEAGFVEILPGADADDPLIRTTEVPRPFDPMFVNAIALLGQATRPLSAVLPILLPRLDDVLLVRLGNHGILRRHHSKFLFLIPTMKWEVERPEPGERLRAALIDTAEGHGEPTLRTGTILSLLSAAEAIPQLTPPLPWDSGIATTVDRVAELAWAPAPVTTVLTAAMAGARASTAPTTSIADPAGGARVARAASGPDD